MKNVLIIGGGFAGLSAAKKLKGEEIDVVLVDKKARTDFLPMLPDIIGKDICLEHITASMQELACVHRFTFIEDTVAGIHLGNKKAVTSAGTLSYDYLIIATGTQTNFYGQNFIRDCSRVLDCADDAQSLRQEAEKSLYDAYVIAGGGYTGIEAATNLKILFSRKKIKKRVIIVERASEILPAMQKSFRKYAAKNLQTMEIEVKTGTTIKKVQADEIMLSSGEKIEKAMLVWSAGVKTGDLVWDLKKEMNPQGRLAVDRFLRLREDVFVAGDAAGFEKGGDVLRMGIQFSIMQGRTAAENIKRSIKGKYLKEFKPVDLGYIIPMANGGSCGIVLGIPVYGWIATFFHYFMCIFRSWTWKNRRGLIKSLVFGR